eukprot:CAMPEP_0201491038 /NCGR_PEP_ID=MMETSP0151_2-20130828/28395_1 /ASSEMBLY_ACC=CAM_ASM_000257 /TAXON_ID=200890 /ORGANISM="Paramoeba atlantica, Strain 621/1 / CCAP 1560/9" /LENGTH=80 /DNA_ID=CAMNT_0047877235 /DNA_START=27 /DNA_END=269 /DNA_ORIENTATION=+
MSEWEQVAESLGADAVDKFMEKFPPQSHAHWVPVAGSFKRDGNTFEFQAEKQGAGAAGPVKSGEFATFTGSAEPLTYEKK